MDINLPRAEIEDAAFWERDICLDCTHVQPHDGDVEACEECGSNAVFPASFILRCADFVDPLSDLD